MGILSASNTITRFRLLDEVPQELWSSIPDSLKKNALQDIDNTPEVRSLGWVTFEHLLDTKWESAPPEKGEYIAFSLRIDTRRIPAAVFNKHFLLAMEEENRLIKEQGKQVVSRERRAEIREIVKLRLMVKTLPTPVVFDVVWATGINIIYFASTQGTVIELFTDLFLQTFGLHLETLTPLALGIEIFKMADLAYTNEFEENTDTALGQDFLTWLWFRSETNPLDFVDAKSQPFIINMERRIVVQGGEGETLETTVVSGTLCELAEARLGLKRGKKVTQACMSLEQDSLSWQYTLKAGDFSFSGLKTPKVNTQDDEPDAIFLEKMYLIERAFGLIDCVYTEFLKHRLDSLLWSDEEKSISDWVNQSRDSI